MREFAPKLPASGLTLVWKDTGHALNVDRPSALADVLHRFRKGTLYARLDIKLKSGYPAPHHAGQAYPQSRGAKRFPPRGAALMRDGDFELVTLRSGARAVRHIGHGEVMHPAGGPWAEANRLYVEQPRLAARLQAAGERPVCIFDIGLGAATNAVAALTCAQNSGGAVEIHSFELDLAPLRLALGDPEGFPFLVPFRAAAQALIATGQWVAPGVRWILHRGNMLDCLPSAPATAELIFFDPFSPQIDLSLWTRAAFAAVRARCLGTDDGALLLTYSAATPMRAALLLGGFYVGAGVATGTKRETTVGATVLTSLEAPLGPRWLSRWERSTARAPIGEPMLTAQTEHELRSHPQFVSGG